MPRRAGVPKRDVLPDPKFNSKVVTKLINQVMYDGKKSTAEGIVYGAFDIVEKKLNQPAIDVFTKALEKRDARSRSQSKTSRRQHVSGTSRYPR